MNYRSDIEGLRAVAILLVVAAHAGVPGLAGGFIGVDVFFVLSGYLITGLLVEEQRRTGRIAIANFYARRFRRLLPALLTMLLVTASLGWLLLPLEQQIDQANAVAAAALWLSNLHFAFSQFNYFSPGAESSLYLHTWSLGVEEQFYLVWPALIVLAIACPRWLKSDADRTLSILLLITGLGSLTLCLWLSGFATHLAFYLMPARAWQFACGALVFVVLGAGPGLRTASPLPRIAATASRLGTPIGLIGLALLGLAVAVLDGTSVYPAITALIPTVAAMCLLASGTVNPGSAVSRALSLRPMQAIGHVSYAWYLWHWPLLILGAALTGSNSLEARLVLVLIALLLAAVSTHFIEAPIRHNRLVMVKPSRAIIAALGLMLAGVAMSIQWQQSTFKALDDPQVAANARAAGSQPSLYARGCDDWYESAELKPCAFGDEMAGKTAIILGDSIGLHWFPALEQRFARNGWRLIALTKAACPIIDETIYYPRIGRNYTECSEWRARAVQYIADLQPDWLIIGSSHTYALSDEQWLGGTQRILESLAPSVGRVAILRSTPVLDFDGPSCAMPLSRAQQWWSATPACESSAIDARSLRVMGLLEASIVGWPNVGVVNMDDLVCPEGTCSARRDGILVFRDQHHLNAAFSVLLADALAERMEQIPQRKSPRH